MVPTTIRSRTGPYENSTISSYGVESVCRGSIGDDIATMVDDGELAVDRGAAVDGDGVEVWVLSVKTAESSGSWIL